MAVFTPSEGVHLNRQLGPDHLSRQRPHQSRPSPRRSGYAFVAPILIKDLQTVGPSADAPRVVGRRRVGGGGDKGRGAPVTPIGASTLETGPEVGRRWGRGGGGGGSLHRLRSAGHCHRGKLFATNYHIASYCIGTG